MTDRLEMFGPIRGWPIQWSHAKCCGADPCCHGNDIWPRRGDLVAYRLVSLFLSDLYRKHLRLLRGDYCLIKSDASLYIHFVSLIVGISRPTILGE